MISGLEADKQIEVIRRVAGMEQTSPDVVEEVEASLRRRMTSTFDQTLEKAGGAPRVAEILNVTDRMTNKSASSKAWTGTTRTSRTRSAA